jgi:hypothetical protein
MFFLGGVQDFSGATPAFTGFSRNANDPSLPAAQGEVRYGPYWQGNPNLLRQDSATGMAFLLDAYGAPFLYFGRAANGTPTYDLTAPAASIKDTNGTTYAIGAVTPYVQSKTAAGTIVYMNDKSFQIISAGENKQFGPGGTAWTPSTGYAGRNAAGNDDLSNFSGPPLGAPSN